jgi:divalent metal cation (Fe/Co/Zn/Cd) transporter
VLFFLKLFAFIISLSYTMLSILLDSFLDIASGGILFLASRAMHNPANVHKYPSGRARLEPLAIIVFASVMFTATFSVVLESVRDLANFAQPAADSLSVPVFVVIGITLVLKLVLLITCALVGKRYGSASLMALAQVRRAVRSI